MRSEEWRCAAQFIKRREFLKWLNAFACFPTTVNRLPYNRLPRILPIASHGAISFCTEVVSHEGSLSVKEPVNGYAVNGKR